MRGRRSRRGIRTGGSRRLRWLLPVVLGVAATLSTSTVRQQTVARYADVEGCLSGCTVAAGGWPLPYLVAHPQRPPGDGVSLAGAIGGADRWRPETLALDLALWTIAAAVLLALLRRLRR